MTSKRQKRHVVLRLVLPAILLSFGPSQAFAEGAALRPRDRLAQRVRARKEGRGPKLLTLSFAGGGVRGVVEVEVMARLEDKLHAKLGPNFKLRDHVAAVAGTSAGAGNAAAFAAGKSYDEMRKAFEQSQKESVFPRTWRRFLSPVISKYSNKRLVDNLEKFYGKATFDDLDIPLVVPVWAESSKDGGGARGLVFENLTHGSPHGNLSVAGLLAATMAAPTFFPLVPGPKPYDAHLHADGAVFNNDPTMTLTATVKMAARPHHERFLIGGDAAVLALGTGRDVPSARQPSKLAKLIPPFAKRLATKLGIQRGILPWLLGKPSLIEAMMDGAGDVAHYQAWGVFGDAYRRIDPLIPNLPHIDDTAAVPQIRKFVANDPALDATIDKAADWVIEQLDLQPLPPATAQAQ